MWLRAEPKTLRAFRFVGLSWLVGRGMLVAIVLFARRSMTERAPNDNKDFVAFPHHPLWDSFCRWDSGWYDRIARYGYVRNVGEQSDVVFFPAFPYLSRWLGPLLGGHWVAGLVLGNLSFLVALLFLHALAQQKLDGEAARRAVWLVLAYPASIFYSAYYTEGLFLLAVAGCFYFFEQEKLLPAGLFGGLAALTRGAGIVLFPALLFGTLERRSWREPLTPRLLWLLLIPASLGIFMVTLSVSVGDPLAFMKEESNFGCSPTLPWNTIVAAVRHFNPGNIMECLDLLATALLLLVAAISVRTLGWAHGIFALGVVALPLFAGRVRSMERYSACVVPLFLVLAAATRRPWPARLVFLAFAAFMVLQTVLFANWYWAG